MRKISFLQKIQNFVEFIVKDLKLSKYYGRQKYDTLPPVTS